MILALHFFDGSVSIDDDRKVSRPTLFLAFFFPVVMLCCRTFLDFYFLSQDRLWIMALLVGTIILLVLIISAYSDFNFRTGKGVFTLPILLVLLMMHVSASIVNINCSYDNSIPVEHITKVSKKEISSKHKFHSLQVETWGPGLSHKELSVSERLYKRTEIGTEVKMFLYEGRLGVPWFKFKVILQ